MHPTIRSGVCLIGLALSASVAAAADSSLMEGNWEVTTKMEIAEMPFAMPPQTHNQCVTKKDFIPDVAQKDQKCTVKDQRASGDTVSWRVQCTGPEGKFEGEGQIKSSGKTYAGAMQAKMTGKDGEVMNMKMSFQGKHTGPCKSGPSKKKPGDY